LIHPPAPPRHGLLFHIPYHYLETQSGWQKYLPPLGAA